MDKKYEHLLHLPHPVSPHRPRLSAAQRAAQFAPFAALTGYEAVIRETARQTQAQVYLDEGEVARINASLVELQKKVGEKPLISLEYFLPDAQKAGGSYRIIRQRLIKIDENQQNIRLESGEIVKFENILKIFELENPT